MSSLDCARRFGENLVRCRKQAGLSQEQLGYRAGLHRTAVGLIERGSRTPRIDTLVKLSAALGVDSGDLLEGITWELGRVSVGRFQT
jgi:transcriptional regulator with XRE-family HTH domain